MNNFICVCAHMTKALQELSERAEKLDLCEKGKVHKRAFGRNSVEEKGKEELLVSGEASKQPEIPVKNVVSCVLYH